MDLVSVVRAPRTPSERPPLLVLLHGVGADEHDLLPLAPHLDPRLLSVSLRAPREAQPMGYAWYDLDWSTVPPAYDHVQAEQSRMLLVETIPALVRRHGTDPDRTFLFGFSQGAAMALAVALTRPDLVRGVVIHSGRLLDGLAGRVARGAALERLEALVLHGIDDPVLPVERGREIRALLAPLLGERLVHAEHDGAHGVTPASLGDARTWLTSRIDGAPAPARQ